MFYLPVTAEVGSVICFGDNQFTVQAGSYIQSEDSLLMENACLTLNARLELITTTPPVSGGGGTPEPAATPPAEEKASKPTNDTPAAKSPQADKE